MNPLKTIKGLILSAALVVSLLIFGGVYLVTSGVYDRAVRENAVTMSGSLAQGTFSAMFQVMRQGWTRPQLEAFIESIQKSGEGSTHRIDIFRGPVVSHLFGPIEQPPIEGLIADSFALAEPRHEETEKGTRFAYPLVARDECLVCHINAKPGDVLGVIRVEQDVSALVDNAHHDLLMALLVIAPLPFLVAFGVAVFLTGRANRSIAVLTEKIEQVNKVSDLTNIKLETMDLGLAELNGILAKVEELTNKMRGVAVDKDLLEFEIRLLEKFVITSEVVKDWREYVSHLLVDINQVISAYNLFSIFKIDDELFDLEVFWLQTPSEQTKKSLELALHKSVADTTRFGEVASLQINHHVARPTVELLELRQDEVEIQTKSLFVDTPKIGGIVGIGVHADLVKDQTRVLVMESILSTLLNVVGSVKAIYKYTRDLEYYATRDPLTNLYNQRLFWELLGYEIGRAERHSYPFALLVIDLDNFKNINDTYGHAFGDKFLQHFAEAVGRALRAGDVFARYGGDEFVVILPEADSDTANTVAERILANSAEMGLETPDNDRVKATVSIGIGIYPEHATDMKDLFLFADNMMYKAKSEGKDRIGLPTEADVVEVFRSIGEKGIVLANAIEERRVFPHYQPILDIENGEIAAVEVLSRIKLRDDTIWGAHEFIELAEKMGVIHKIDYIAMERAFQAIRAHDYQGLIFLNLSPRALVVREFIREVKRLTALYDIEPTKVVFEITERDTVKNLSLLEQFVNDLKLEGFQLAIDDFGSGFSSFHYLKRFPIDIVKIEGDFVRNMVADRKDRAFVYSMSELCRQLRIRTVAEFVEDGEVLAEVSRCGITYAQGYHIGKPVADLAEALNALKMAEIS